MRLPLPDRGQLLLASRKLIHSFPLRKNPKARLLATAPRDQLPFYISNRLQLILSFRVIHGPGVVVSIAAPSDSKERASVLFSRVR